MLIDNVLYPALNFRIRTPDGTATINIAHDPDDMVKIEHVEINIGKAGSSVAAWSNAFAKMVILALQNGVPLDIVIAQLSDIATDRVVVRDGITCRSGPEALAIALRSYRRYIPRKLKEEKDYEPERD